MAIYQRGDNWYIDFYFKGQRVRESIGHSRKNAQKVIGKRKTEIIEGKYLDIRKEPDPITFHQFGVEYRKWSLTEKKESTCSRELYIMRALDRVFGQKNLHEITGWDIEQWKSERRKVCKVASVNRELCLLKHMFKKALEWKKIKENPLEDVRNFKGANKRIRYLMPDEIQALLSNCDGLMRGLLRPFVIVALHTGARKGELQHLRWSEVNFDLGNISLLETKNGDRRDIPMNETVRETLEGLDRSRDLVFPNRNGKVIDNTQIHLSFHEALKRSRIEDFKIHDLRHTFASNLVMAGVQLNDVRELLGHRKMEMTMRYAHLSPKHKTKVVSILDKVIGRSQNPPQERKVVNLRG